MPETPYPLPSGPPPASICELLQLPPAQRDQHLDLVVPKELRAHYDLPPGSPWQEGRGTFRWGCGPRGSSVRLEVWPRPDAADPGFTLELADTHLGKLEAAWIVLNDLDGPRYSVDRRTDGRPLPLGSNQRNLSEELRALAAGLAPNQVRPGLRMFRPLIQRIEAFCQLLGVDTLLVAPLAYHNAIKYEQYGFTYASGEEELEWIHREFQPGGVLRRRMDGSRPFRMPWMAQTIRGRSWAVHDGVLERRWMAPQMYKFVGRDFQTRSFPGAVW